jgi:hypothetical protein
MPRRRWQPDGLLETTPIPAFGAPIKNLAAFFFREGRPFSRKEAPAGSFTLTLTNGWIVRREGGGFRREQGLAGGFL